MLKKRITIILLVNLVVVAIAGIFVATSAASGAPSIRQLVQVVPNWQQVNSSGFGNTEVLEVSAVEAFNGFLYAGTYRPLGPGPGLDGAQVFRSSDGEIWTAVSLPGFGSAHDNAPPAILDFVAFNAYLYAGTGRGNASQIWRTQNGTIWAPIDVTGFSDSDNTDVTVLKEFDGKIFAGVTNQVSGAQIWNSFTGDNNSWITDTVPTVVGTEKASVTDLEEFNGVLYAAISSDAPAQVWRRTGTDWTAVMTDGFGDSDNATSTGGMAVFGNELYVGAGNTNSGARLWRTNDGATWIDATPAFGASGSEKVEMVFVFQNQLYLGVTTGSGIAIWRSSDGSSWEQANVDGFGDMNNTITNGSNATAGFLDQLYVGTVNTVDGGELWRMQRAFDLSLSPDEGKSGLPGETVTYTLAITNTGYMTDSFDLAASGQSWTTILSTASVSELAPAASTNFSATVAIPPGAAFQATDVVTITAISQGDSSRSNATVLTTTTAEMVCGIAVDTPYMLGDISVTITAMAGSNLDCVRVTKHSSNHPNATTSLETGQYWTIDGLQSDQRSAATVDYVFHLTLPHNVDPYQEALVCKYLGGTGTGAWDCAQSGSEIDTVSRGAIDIGFSDWAVSAGAPTALTLNTFEASGPSGQSDLAVIFGGLFAAATLVWGFWRGRRKERHSPQLGKR